MYTGKFIPKGTLVGGPEPLIPIYEFDAQENEDEVDEDDEPPHPPLREFLWDGNDFKRLVLESYQGMMIFSPGLAAVAPCTSQNFHLERVVDVDVGESNDSIVFDHAQVQRATDPTAGSFTYYQVQMFRAVRDIHPGEELTVECSDDDFDASLWSGDRMEYNPNLHMCLDDKVERKPSTIPKVGQGIFAKKRLETNSVVLSSPAVPIHRKLLMMNSMDPPRMQLLLNYCFGPSESDVLWLPYGPLIHSINHRYSDPSTTTTSTKSQQEQPNVKIVWHADPEVNHNDQLSRRQQYHHPELLDLLPGKVTDIHGKGLLMDVVAIRDIAPGEELFLDYGEDWREMWNLHFLQWAKKIGPKLPPTAPNESYISAWEFNAHAQAHELEEPIRTITEQHRNPYPHNIMTACRFEKDWIDDEFAEDYDMIQYQSWNTQKHHYQCLLPCLILERLESDGETTYTAKLVDHHHENGKHTMVGSYLIGGFVELTESLVFPFLCRFLENIEYMCHIFRRFEYIYTDIPRRGIEFIETTYSSDLFLPPSFRHPIGPSEAMWPEHWMRRNHRVRRRATTTSTAQTMDPKADEDPNIFKRKNVEPKIDKQDLQRKRDASPRNDL